MKFLITIMFLMAGCGLDPDDYRVKKSDGCPSSGCAEPAPEPEPAAEPVADHGEFACEDDGRLCRGMTMDKVLEIVGEPGEIRNFKSIDAARWLWVEPGLESVYCVDSGHDWKESKCNLYFRDGLLSNTNDFAPKWIDILTFQD